MSAHSTSQSDSSSNPSQQRMAYRVDWIDIARGLALIAMAIFHFTWDLEAFGLLEPGFTFQPPCRWFARSIATSFLILAGISIYLAHFRTLHLNKFLWRLFKISLVAAAITLATYFATPGQFIFFGILHNIALSSVLALLVIRLPVFIIAGLGLFLISGKFWLTSAAFDSMAWWWTGLSVRLPISNDYVPVFPWTGWVFIGLASAKSGLIQAISNQLGSRKWQGMPADLLRFIGNHSLVFYVLHQPIMIGILYLIVRFVLPSVDI